MISLWPEFTDPACLTILEEQVTAKNQVPAEGAKIEISNGKLQVPDNPIVPFIEGDGIASRRASAS